jgi:hypothetical protein
MLRELSKVYWRALFVAAALLVSLTSHAQGSQVNATCTNPAAQGTLLNEVHTIADPSQGVPLECTFSVAVAGTYTITLTDLGVVPGSNPVQPAPLASVGLALTQGATVVGTPITAAGTLQFTGQVGTYVIRVVGNPSTTLGSGPVGIVVTNNADSSVLASFSATLAPPGQQLKANESVLDDSFTVDTDGNYVVTLADLQLPQALTTLTLIVTTNDGTLVTNPFLTAAGSTTVALTHGVTYRIFAAGLADPTVNAGLFGASVTAVGGASPVYSKVIPVGTVAAVAATSSPLTAGGSYTLTLTDLALPTALATVGAVAVANGQVAAQLTAAGTSAPFTSVAATYQVFAAATSTTTGSYAVSLASGGTAALSVARAVSASGTTGPVAYSYDTTVTTAGSYTLGLTDFSFPKSFASLSAVAVQAGAALGTPLTVAGTQSVTAAAGPLSVLVFAQADPAGGLFGVDLGASGATPLLSATQGVGQLFIARQVSITSAGNYAVNVSDVGFPAKLANFAVVVTSGASQVGQIYGGGAFNFAATPGNYFINFIAQPDSTALAGTYALSVAAGPSATLTSDVSTVGSGGTVNLKWSSENATSCTASGGGWTGTLATSGNQTSPAITTDTTFTVSCSGEGTSASASVKITVTTPPAQSSGGGGGSIDVLLLLVLLGWVIGRSYIRHAR